LRFGACSLMYSAMAAKILLSASSRVLRKKTKLKLARHQRPSLSSQSADERAPPPQTATEDAG
jgi:hypothetical protein